MMKIPDIVPLPFFISVAVPVLIPITKHTSAALAEQIKTKPIMTPADPYEAELLIMADLLAADKQKEDEIPKDVQSKGRKQDITQIFVCKL